MLSYFKCECTHMRVFFYIHEEFVLFFSNFALILLVYFEGEN